MSRDDLEQLGAGAARRPSAASSAPGGTSKAARRASRRRRRAVDQARTQLLHTSIRAPFEAFVLRRQVEVGSGVAGVSQSASGGSIMMTLGDARESALYAKATAADARRLRPGMPARVRLDSDASVYFRRSCVRCPRRAMWTRPRGSRRFRLSSRSRRSRRADGSTCRRRPRSCCRQRSTRSPFPSAACAPIHRAGRTSIVQGQTGNRSGRWKLGVVQQDRIQIRSGLDKGQTVFCRRRDDRDKRLEASSVRRSSPAKSSARRSRA